MALSRRTASRKVLRDKAFNIAKNPNYDGYRCGLALLVYNFLIKGILMFIFQVVLLRVELC